VTQFDILWVVFCRRRKFFGWNPARWFGQVQYNNTWVPQRSEVCVPFLAVKHRRNK